MLKESLCGNSYGCTPDVDGAIGYELDYCGEVVCGRCSSIAIAITEFMIGEPIEYVTALDGWYKSSEVLDLLLDTLLGRALVAQGIIQRV